VYFLYYLLDFATLSAAAERRYSVYSFYLLYWYTRTNTDAATLSAAAERRYSVYLLY
jgi:hypothetical protein